MFGSLLPRKEASIGCYANWSDGPRGFVGDPAYSNKTSGFNFDLQSDVARLTIFRKSLSSLGHYSAPEASLSHQLLITFDGRIRPAAVDVIGKT
jgi:hypothetical protein